ncbi:Flp family type IVb pilin [Acidimangrovimonas sediminis]|uniref:Flp family type IVb pilin n=1 Tax=Acidimangrovimonas sediminis TaxID=2056283 RepID=UPI000C7FEC6E|nr:pilus assembly protein [Acidimangrovimonas sediminis]
MKLFNLIKNFRNDEDGAVTVDWVVLTAAIVGLGIVVMNTVGGGINTAAAKLGSNLSTAMDNAGDTSTTTSFTSK